MLKSADDLKGLALSSEVSVSLECGGWMNLSSVSRPLKALVDTEKMRLHC